MSIYRIFDCFFANRNCFVSWEGAVIKLHASLSWQHPTSCCIGQTRGKKLYNRGGHLPWAIFKPDASMFQSFLKTIFEEMVLIIIFFVTSAAEASRSGQRADWREEPRTYIPSVQSEWNRGGFQRYQLHDFCHIQWHAWKVDLCRNV